MSIQRLYSSLGIKTFKSSHDLDYLLIKIYVRGGKYKQEEFLRFYNL